MVKNELFFLSIIILIISVLLAEISSRWIDNLYRKNTDIISLPLTKSSRLRRACLAIGLLICGHLLFKALICPAFSEFITGQNSEINPCHPFTLFLMIPTIVLLLVITATDFEVQLIFDAATLPLAVLGLISTIFNCYNTNSYTTLLDNLLAASIGGLLFFLLAIITKGGIGGGDIKLIAALGLWLGPARLTTVICTGLLLGGTIAFLLLITGRKKRGDSFAYGPCFTIPALLSLLMRMS